MTQSSALQRHICLIRQIEPPYVYPSKEYLAENLSNKGFASTSKRTVERDMKSIEDEYGLSISYSRSKKGYYLHLPTDEDISDFLVFINLMERRQRLDFLTQSVGPAHDISRYLQLERNDSFRGAKFLPLIWEALRSGRVISFTYASFNLTKVSQRRIEPGLVFEYQNRWYLAGWDLEVNQLRTFGLDRMDGLLLTNQKAFPQRKVNYRSFRQHAIGVTSPTDAPVERVVLRFSAQEGQYVESLRLHSSQCTLYKDSIIIDIELRVILNHELEREILAYGEEVEVLEPAALRQKISLRLTNSQKKYTLK
jgi:predicted DNA-binding transcriptional regulator YafY